MIDLISSPMIRYRIDRELTHIDDAARRSETEESAELRQVTRDFEALFITMVLDSMRESLDDNALIPKNSGEKLFEDQLYDEYTKKISQTAGLGIATMMYDQLSRDLPGNGVDLDA